MHISQLKESKFLKKEDCGSDGTLVTITSVSQENVAAAGAPEEYKWCLHVAEFDKPMVLNSTNGQVIAKITGSEDTDDWSGKQVVLYNDPNVSYAGKIIGGIRARAPQRQAVAPAQRPPATASMPAATGANKVALKSKFKAHPEFNKKFTAHDVNEATIKRWGVKLDELNEMQASEAMDQFDAIVTECIDNIPF